jgi:hypothetical protein
MNHNRIEFCSILIIFVYEQGNILICLNILNSFRLSGLEEDCCLILSSMDIWKCFPSNVNTTGTKCGLHCESTVAILATLALSITALTCVSLIDFFTPEEEDGGFQLLLLLSVATKCCYF